MRKPGAVRLLIFAQSRFEFFRSLFLSEAVCSTGDPISIFKKDSESSNVVLHNIYTRKQLSKLTKNVRAHECGGAVGDARRLRGTDIYSNRTRSAQRTDLSSATRGAILIIFFFYFGVTAQKIRFCTLI